MGLMIHLSYLVTTQLRQLFHSLRCQITNSFQDKNLVYSAFPGLAKNLVPPPSPSGLESLDIPANFRIQFLSDSVLVDRILSSFTEQLDNDENTHLCISLDAEWNISRTVGVSILQLAPHSEDTIFIIPVGIFNCLAAFCLRNSQGPSLQKSSDITSEAPHIRPRL
jgi:hypothetical protein